MQVRHKKTAHHSKLTNKVTNFYYHAEVGATPIACT